VLIAYRFSNSPERGERRTLKPDKLQERGGGGEICKAVTKEESFDFSIVRKKKRGGEMIPLPSRIGSQRRKNERPSLTHFVCREEGEALL